MSSHVASERCQWVGCWERSVDEFDLCEAHFKAAGAAFIEARSIWGSTFGALRRAALKGPADRTQVERDNASRARSVVYYVRIQDHIKIGYTTHLPSRLSQLRVDRTALLAAEPGWREVEAKRHSQFAAERQGRREDFNPSRRLLAHIGQVRDEHGDPWGTGRPS